MKYEEAARKCHVRSAIYRESQLIRYWKNHTKSLDERIPEHEKLEDDWEEFDPRDNDSGTLFMFND